MSEPVKTPAAPVKDALEGVAPKKNQKTPAQLELLAKARVRALEVRKENTALRAKQREIDQLQKMKERQAIEEKHKELLKASEPETQFDMEPEPEPSSEPPKAKAKKKKIIVVEESESDSEEEVVMVKKKKKTPAAPQQVSQLVPRRPNPLFM